MHTCTVTHVTNIFYVRLCVKKVDFIQACVWYYVFISYLFSKSLTKCKCELTSEYIGAITDSFTGSRSYRPSIIFTLNRSLHAVLTFTLKTSPRSLPLAQTVEKSVKRQFLEVGGLSSVLAYNSRGWFSWAYVGRRELEKLLSSDYD